MQACSGTVFWAYNFIKRRWLKKKLFIPTKSSNSDLLLNFVAFRISREVNPVPAIANFTDLNQEVFLLAAYGNVNGSFYGCYCCTFVFFLFVHLPFVYVLTIAEYLWVWYEELCRSGNVLPIEAECSESEICIISLACVSSETHNLRRAFLRIKETQKGRGGGGGAFW